MTKTELQNAADEIRQFLIESDLDNATEHLLAVAKKISPDAYEQATLIAANWNHLEREIRGSLIRPDEELVQRSNLTDNIMELLKDLEAMRVRKNSPEIPAKPVEKSNSKAVYGIIAIAALVMAVVLFWESKTPIDKRGTPSIDTEKTVEDSPSEETVSANKESYKRHLKSGNIAFGKQNFEKALIDYKNAARAYNSLEIRGKIEETKDKLYRKYFTQGMDFFSAKNYAAAKREFEKAQNFKDFRQVQSMIKKCEANL